MSTLRVQNLTANSTSNNVISVINGKLDRPGKILQAHTVRSDVRMSYSTLNSGNGTPIAQLNMGLFPRRSDSWVLVQWMICGEGNHNQVWLIHENDALITTAPYQGFNNVVGNTARWVGYVPFGYDNDDSSTPHNYFVQWYGPVVNTDPRIYTPAVRSSDGSNRSWFLNRCIGNLGADGNENMISTGVIMEIAA
jgi:hypothetical protein